MKSFFSFLISHKFPKAERFPALFDGPLTIPRSLFYGLFAGLLIVVYLLIIALNNTLLVMVPARGGNLTEGIVGAPRFLNPVLAATDTDVAITRLVFAGLMKEEGDGTLKPELAEKYEVSPDGKTYTFTLRDKLFFHDGSALTSSDVAFTVEKLQNPLLSQTLAAQWQDVGVETPNEQTVVFTLLSPNSVFLHMASVGIMSADEWQGVADEAFVDPGLNLEPVGAGAFKVDSVERDGVGAVSKVHLSKFRRYALGTPLLSSLTITTFSNKESLLLALQTKTIDLTFDLSPQNVPEGVALAEITILSIPTNKHIALYRREGENALSNVSLLAALNRFVDKASIVATVENGYGIPLMSEDTTLTSTPVSLEETQALLAKLGYSVTNGVLGKGGSSVAMGIATSNDETLIATGHALSRELAAVGILSEVQAFDQGTFHDELAAGVFSLVLTDTATTLPSNYHIAIPLYTTVHLLAHTSNAHGIPQEALYRSDLRYANVLQWHTRTDRVWRWFTR